MALNQDRTQLGSTLIRIIRSRTAPIGGRCWSGLIPIGGRCRSGCFMTSSSTWIRIQPTTNRDRERHMVIIPEIKYWVITGICTIKIPRNWAVIWQKYPSSQGKSLCCSRLIVFCQILITGHIWALDEYTTLFLNLLGNMLCNIYDVSGTPSIPVAKHIAEKPFPLRKILDKTKKIKPKVCLIRRPSIRVDPDKRPVPIGVFPWPDYVNMASQPNNL